MDPNTEKLAQLYTRKLELPKQRIVFQQFYRAYLATVETEQLRMLKSLGYLALIFSISAFMARKWQQEVHDEVGPGKFIRFEAGRD